MNRELFRKARVIYLESDERDKDELINGIIPFKCLDDLEGYSPESSILELIEALKASPMEERKEYNINNIWR